MNQTVESRKYYPTALALYITYFVLGVAATIMGQYKQNFAALWGASTLADGSYDVSGVVAVIAAIGLGRLVAFPVAGPLSDRLGRRLSALIGCGLYAIFLLGFFAAGGVLQLVTAVANEMFPKNRGVITSIVMISSSVANYIVISVAGVLTRVGDANGPRLVVLFNMAVTLVGILLAVYLNICQKRERAAQVQ